MIEREKVTERESLKFRGGLLLGMIITHALWFIALLIAVKTGAIK
jgi:hypothetical protein